LNLDRLDVLIVTLCVGGSNFIWLPVMGALSDRIGRRPMLIAFAIGAAIAAYPLMSWLAHRPSFGRLLAVELMLSVLYCGYNGPMVARLAEIMPLEVRVAGFAVAYSLATAVFGGFTLAINQYAIHLTGNPAMPGVWLAVSALSALSAALVLRSAVERNGPRDGTPDISSVNGGVSNKASNGTSEGAARTAATQTPV
jgi:MFS family permease